MKGFLSISVIGIIAVVLFGAYYYSTVEFIELKVNDKEITVSGNHEHTSSKYLVFTDDEVFENTDSWLFLKFNSSDIQNKLKPNEKYVVKVVGWRIPFLSMYRNVLEVQK